MKFGDIEGLLGRDAVARVESCVASAYEASGGRREGVCALRELLIGVLAAVVTTERYRPAAEQLAAEDAAQLNALVRKIKEIAPRQPVAASGASTSLTAEVRRLRSRGSAQTPGAEARTTGSCAVLPFSDPIRRSRARPELAASSRPARAARGEDWSIAAAGCASAARGRSAASHGFAVPQPDIAASLSASRSAIARRKQLTAEKWEALARSQVLLARSRSLRTSLEAAQAGRHY